jgi:hypothetical protein
VPSLGRTLDYQEITGDQGQQDDSPTLVIPGRWLVYTWQKLEVLLLQWDKWTFFYARCHPSSVSVAIVLTLVFAIGLSETAPAHWSQWKVFISSLLLLLDRMHNYYLLLLIWFPFVVPEPSSCDLCMHNTQEGHAVTRTFLFHTYYSCTGSVVRSCTHNHITYIVCSHGNQHICFSLTYYPWEQCL